MPISIIRMICAILLILAFIKSGAATTIERDGTVITSVKNIVVNNKYYDISFKDGNYSQVFGNSKFQFNNLTIANAASQALLDQVFTSENAQLGVYAFNVFGCTYSPTCLIWTPYAEIGEHRTIFISTATVGFDAQYINSSYVDAWDQNTSYLRNVVYGVWTESKNPVIPSIPEPEQLGMLVLGTLVIALFHRKKHSGRC